MFPIWMSVKCGLLSGLINLPWGIFWGWFLARREFRGKTLLQTLLFIPLVLPPVLTGYFLLVLFSKSSPVGIFLHQYLGLNFVLDWKGAVIASTVVSGPFMILAVKQAVAVIDPRFEFAAQNLGAGTWRVFWTITFPLSWPGIVAGFFLVFARSIGEFGATIILAGNIPGKTQTIPLAIYNSVYLGREETILPLITATLVLTYLGLAASHQFSALKYRPRKVRRRGHLRAAHEH